MPDFDDFLDRVEKALPSKGVLIIMFDEFEQLQDSMERGKLSPDIFPYLRSLMQNRSCIAFVLAGTHKLEEMSKDYWSTLFHIGLSRRISSLSRQESEKLIREPVFPTIEYEERAVEQIYLVTQGHPYFLQLICHDLISMVNIEVGRPEPITAAHVKQIIKKVVGEEDDQLRHLWNETTREERLVLAALSLNPEANAEKVSRAEIAARLNGANLSNDVITQAVERLLMHDLVKMQGVDEQRSLWDSEPETELPTISRAFLYSISFDLFRQWVAKKHPLGSLLP
jgi:hypothetical protein